MKVGFVKGTEFRRSRLQSPQEVRGNGQDSAWRVALWQHWRERGSPPEDREGEGENLTFTQGLDCPPPPPRKQQDSESQL